MTAPPPVDLPDLSGLSLLVVDDNDDAVDMLTTFLRACGASVLMARSAIGALAYIDTTPKLDAVITDVAMPNMDGVEFLRKVRGHPARSSLPIIALTGFYENYPGSVDFNAFLRKPVNLDELCTTIKAVTQHGHR